jgi:acyl-CoA synthetase (AMP-forming)/AMP-acid ligase II
MDFALSPRAADLQARLLAYMDECVYPAEAVYEEQMAALGDPHGHPRIIEDLKAEARSRGLWNLFMPHVTEWTPDPVSNLDYAHLAEITGRSMHLAPEAPDTAARFLDALEHEGPRARHLFLLGDVFELWVGDDGADLAWDGRRFGRLLVRGPWVVGSYFKGDGGQVLDADGWFDTGDVATIDQHGYMQIVDRSKDVIKSGGEWISSIDLENAAVGAPGVAEAAVIGVAHPKWDERPLLLIREKEGATVSKESVLAYLDGKIAKWWMPDDVLIVADLPHTATGKLLKTELRERFKDYKLPTA